MFRRIAHPAYVPLVTNVTLWHAQTVDICFMIVAGYVAAALIGLSLGLVGGGGSILTVPVLVYLFGVTATVATYYSLFIVGCTSLVGALSNYRQGNVRVRVAGLFGVSSVITVLLVRRFLLPLIPETIQFGHSASISRATVTMLLFALLMIVASISMIRGQKATGQPTDKRQNAVPQLVAAGVGIGIVTAVLGAGGGFLLIPFLVLLLHLPMKQAVGTSLLIISLNSLIGFAGDVGSIPANWSLLLLVTGIAVCGILVGTWLAKKVPGYKLKKGFGWFVLIMGIYIVIKETFIG